MAKLVLKAAPTFKAIVDIPVPGGLEAEIEFTFKHRTRDELDAFVKLQTGRDIVDTVLDIAEGWDLADPFCKASLQEFAQNYITGPAAVYEKYLAELVKARIKN